MSDVVLLSVPEAGVSLVKDPFFGRNITGIRLHWSKGDYGSDYCRGSVEFENENTKGEQKFKADNLDDLIVQVAAFVKTLPKQPE